MKPEDILRNNKYSTLQNLVLVCEAMEEYATGFRMYQKQAEERNKYLSNDIIIIQKRLEETVNKIHNQVDTIQLLRSINDGLVKELECSLIVIENFMNNNNKEVLTVMIESMKPLILKAKEITKL